MKSNDIFCFMTIGIAVVIIAIIITVGVMDVNHSTEFEYWHEGEVVEIYDCIDSIVGNAVDSLVVTSSSTPYPIGVIRFESYDGRK